MSINTANLYHPNPEIEEQNFHFKRQNFIIFIY